VTDKHGYEVRPRKDKRGVDLISDVCHSVASGTPGQMQSAMQLDTPNTAADHIMPWFAFTMKLAT